MKRPAGTRLAKRHLAGGWKFLQILTNEYRRLVFRKGFLINLVSLPLALIFVFAALLVTLLAELDLRPVGYVDPGQVLSAPASGGRSDRPTVEILPFESEAAAENALQQQEIQSYFVLPPGYPQDPEVRLVTERRLKTNAKLAIEEFLRNQLLSGQPAEVAHRIREGQQLVLRTPDGMRQYASRDVLKFVTPFATGYVFLAVLFSTSSYMTYILTAEKENRMMEVLLTSVSPGQLMGAKTVAIAAVGLSKILLWAAPLLPVLLVLPRIPGAQQALQLDLSPVGLAALFFLPSFVLVSGLMAAAGAIVADSREGSQVSILLNLVIVAPYWLMFEIILHPNSPLVVGLSLFPLTAPLTLILRASFTKIPLWQTGSSLALLLLGGLGAVWLAGRALRKGMLQYGRRLTLRQFFGREGRR